MSKEEFKRHILRVQNEFKGNRFQLLIATKAFGMGIDKQNIHYTFHYGLPSSVEALYQEAGRAGRWDKQKEENKNKTGKCFILHSPETQLSQYVDQLFHISTTFAEMEEIALKAGRQGKDIFKQIYLFRRGQNDIERDFEIIWGLITNYFVEKSKVVIFWQHASETLNIERDLLEKAIYRLSLLGIVSDWTTDFRNHYEVEFNKLDDSHIIKNLNEYISKYEPNTNIEDKISKNPQKTVLEKAIWFLLKWIFENVAYSRKQSLKTLYDWCTSFHQNGGSEEFKRRLDSYFVFTNTTSTLQEIAENPSKYENWFKALFKSEEFELDGVKQIKQIHIPSITNLEERRREYEGLRDSISRFLESYRNNQGINFLSGFVRLALDEFEDSDGRARFEGALSILNKNLSLKQQRDLLVQIKTLGKNLTASQKIDLSRSISVFYPEMLVELADYYCIPELLTDYFQAGLNKLSTLNKNLYEHLGKIQ